MRATVRQIHFDAYDRADAQTIVGRFPDETAHCGWGMTADASVGCAQIDYRETVYSTVDPSRSWTLPGYSAEYHQSQPGAAKGRVKATVFTVFLGTGEGRIAVDSDRFQSTRLQAGDMRFLPEGTTVRTVVTKPAPCLVITLTPERIDEFSRTLFGDRPGRLVPRVRIRTPNAQRLHLMLREYLESRSDWGTLYLESLLNLIAAEVLHQAWDRPDAGRAVRHSLSPTVRRRVVDYIEGHLSSGLSLNELATVAGLSPFHFARCFQQELGKTPHRYVLDRRLELARRLLSETECPLAEIASRCGFSSQSHLTTAFRKAMGVTPGQYRIGCA
jgi:AraC family transcriptional regulator